MADYGQFCPVAKATELVGERWTLLILRELLLGSHRFNDFQRALSNISPSLLTKRLRQLEQAGILVRKSAAGGRRYDYFLTPAGKQLAPIIEHLAVWGMRWARKQLSERELDVEFLMWEMQRRLQIKALPDGETVICFIFDELEKHRSWWLVVRNDEVDLCTENPGKDVDLYVTATVRDLVRVWQGDMDIKLALDRQLIRTQGDQGLAKTLPDWLGICLYAHIERGDPALMMVAAKDVENDAE